MEAVLVIGIFIVVVGAILFLVCLPFALLGVRSRRSTPKKRSVKEEVIQAQREYDWFWRNRR